jgi:hypothetical protein
MAVSLTRAQMIEIVRAVDHPALRYEIAHQMSVEREYFYDEVAAVFDAEERATTWFYEGNASARSLQTAARKVLVSIGFYRVMTSEEVENTYTSDGRSPWSFKLAGVPYTHDDPSETWMFPNHEEDGQDDIG